MRRNQSKYFLSEKYFHHAVHLLSSYHTEIILALSPGAMYEADKKHYHMVCVGIYYAYVCCYLQQTWYKICIQWHSYFCPPDQLSLCFYNKNLHYVQQLFNIMRSSWFFAFCFLLGMMCAVTLSQSSCWKWLKNEMQNKKNCERVQ